MEVAAAMETDNVLAPSMAEPVARAHPTPLHLQLSMLAALFLEGSLLLFPLPSGALSKASSNWSSTTSPSYLQLTSRSVPYATCHCRNLGTSLSE